LILLTVVLAGCQGGGDGLPFGRCGSYTLRSPTAGIDEPAEERCSSGQGTYGNWDLMGDGQANLVLRAHDYDDAVGWFEAELTFPNAQLTQVGATIEPASFATMYSWGTGLAFDEADPTDRVEITVERIGTDYDDVWEEAYFRLSWRGSWGDPSDGPFYTAEGEDWVGFMDAPNPNP
jgi:hypothetical protein